jgi:prepilin signal peptidase PulO-like enzyme (type II secretory pathway)
VYFSADNLALVLAQAACVALPGAGLPTWAVRLRTRWWALALPLSIAVVVAAIAAAPTVATVLTWVALVLVPPGCALALGWAGRGARPQLASVAAPLLVLAWVDPGGRLGGAATTLLIAGSAVTLGRLLAGLTPLTLLKAGVVAMAVVDAYLVFTNRLQAPNATLVAASPGPGLPQLQSAYFGAASLGYGDFFAAAVVGAILAAERRNQLVAAAVTIAFSLAWDQLFAIYDVLPATIPPALTLLVFTGWRRARRSQDRLPSR